MWSDKCKHVISDSFCIVCQFICQQRAGRQQSGRNPASCRLLLGTMWLYAASAAATWWRTSPGTGKASEADQRSWSIFTSTQILPSCSTGWRRTLGSQCRDRTAGIICTSLMSACRTQPRTSVAARTPTHWSLEKEPFSASEVLCLHLSFDSGKNLFI